MGKRGMRRGRAFLIDLFLLLMVSALYVGTGGNDAPRVLSNAVMAPVYRGSGEGVALLCAVEWEAAALPAILDTLAARETRVTFAVSGRYARAHPDMLRRMAEAGHEIAAMGDDPAMDGALGAVTADVRASAASIAALTLEQPALYYSGGRNVNVSARAAKKLGLTQIVCTADLLCAKGAGADIVKRASEAAIQGSILLVQPTASFLESLPALLDELQTKGLRVAAVGDVLKRE